MSAGRNYLMLRGRREGGKKGGGRREGDKKGGGRERGQHVGNVCLVYFSNDQCSLPSQISAFVFSRTVVTTTYYITITSQIHCLLFPVTLFSPLLYICK